MVRGKCCQSKKKWWKVKKEAESMSKLSVIKNTINKFIRISLNIQIKSRKCALMILYEMTL